MQNKNNLNLINIGENLRKWRHIKNIKQKELAKRMNLSEAAISNLENDVTVPTIHQVEDIANALEIKFLDLFKDPLNHKENHQIVIDNKNYTDKEVLQIMLEKLDKKDEQMQLFIQELINSLTPYLKK